MGGWGCLVWEIGLGCEVCDICDGVPDVGDVRKDALGDGDLWYGLLWFKCSRPSFGERGQGKGKGGNGEGQVMFGGKGTNEGSAASQLTAPNRDTGYFRGRWSQRRAL